MLNFFQKEIYMNTNEIKEKKPHLLLVKMKHQM